MHSNDSTVLSDDYSSQPNLKNYLNANYLLESLSQKSETLQLLSDGASSVTNPLQRSLETYQVADT